MNYHDRIMFEKESDCHLSFYAFTQLRQQLRIVRNEIDKISEELHEPETETCTPGVSCNEDEEVQRVLRSKLLTLIDQEEKLTQEIKSSK